MLNRWVLSRDRKTATEGADVTRSGRPFQTRTAATGKARSPTVGSQVRLTINDEDELERSRWRASTSATLTKLVSKVCRCGPVYCSLETDTLGCRSVGEGHRRRNSSCGFGLFTLKPRCGNCFVNFYIRKLLQLHSVGIDLKELGGGGQMSKCLKFCPEIEI